MSNATIDLCPGADPNNPADRTSKRQAWIGRNPDNTSQTGAYFKGPMWIGGTSTATAPFVVDSAGNVSINGNVLVSGTVTLSAITGWNGASINVGSGGFSFSGGGGITVMSGGDIHCDPGAVYAHDVKCNPVGGAFWFGTEPGLYTTRVVKDGSGNNKTVYIKGGIIVGWDL